MDNQDRFLGLQPVAVVRWPQYLESHRFSHRARKCSKPSEFWAHLTELEQRLPDSQKFPKQASM
eukprot:1503900-Lingulodinium_polyedra.AAC.1